MRTSFTPHKENSTILWIVIFVLALMMQWAHVELKNDSKKAACEIELHRH
jgi:hypothetical protein